MPDDWIVGCEKADAAWEAIFADTRLDRARSQLSLHEIRLMVGHVQRPYAAEITRLRELLSISPVKGDGDA